MSAIYWIIEKLKPAQKSWETTVTYETEKKRKTHITELWLWIYLEIIFPP
jgi:hypothetical protein